MSAHLTRLSCLLAAWASLVALPASAHHSFAMYDQTKLVDVEGEVREFQWTNPHVILWVLRDAEPGPGKERELWTIELPTSTGNLARMDWSKRSLQPGDRVKVEINPLRDGQHGGSFKKVTIAATGKVLTASPPPAPPDAGPPPAAAVTPAPEAKSGCSSTVIRPGTRRASLCLFGALVLLRRRSPRVGRRRPFP